MKIEFDETKLSKEDLDLIIKLTSFKEDFKPEIGEHYCFVTSGGGVDYDEWAGDDFDKDTYAIGNCFRTTEEAVFRVKQLRVEHDIKRLAKQYNGSWKPDWKDENEPKYIIFQVNNKITIDDAYTHRYMSNEYYFKDKESCEKAIKEIGEENLLKYWFGE